jgi:hypothetical protein
MTKKIGRFLSRDPYGPGSPMRATARSTKGILKKLVDGWGGAADVIGPAERPSRRIYTGRGIEGDWAAVGHTLRRAALTAK